MFRLEDGEEVVVDKSAVTPVSEDELASRPFSVRKKRSKMDGNGSGNGVAKGGGKGDSGDVGRSGREDYRDGGSGKRSRSRSRSFERWAYPRHIRYIAYLLEGGGGGGRSLIGLHVVGRWPFCCWSRVVP